MGDFQGLVHSIIAHAWCHFEVPHGPICRIRSHYAILKVAGDMPNWSSGEATQALDSDLVPHSTGASTQPTWVDYIYTLLIGRMYSEANGSVRIVGIEVDAIHMGLWPLRLHFSECVHACPRSLALGGEGMLFRLHAD